MHRQETPDFGSIRSAAWLLIDLIDEACERPEGRRHRVALTSCRWRVVDVLHDVRKLEPAPDVETLPGQLDLTRDFPA